jgi:hypothetical protein
LDKVGEEGVHSHDFFMAFESEKYYTRTVVLFALLPVQLLFAIIQTARAYFTQKRSLNRAVKHRTTAKFKRGPARKPFKKVALDRE